MRLRIEATGDALVAALVQVVYDVHPDLADRLRKALPEPEDGQPANPVIRDLCDNFSAAYERQMTLMLKDVGRVLDGAVREVAKGGWDGEDDLDEPLCKSLSHRYLRREWRGNRWHDIYALNAPQRPGAVLTHEEHQAVGNYSSLLGEHYNRCLREGAVSPRDMEQVEHIRHAIAQTRLGQDMTLHRGIGIEPNDDGDEPGVDHRRLEEGQTFYETGFLSTSTSPDVALYFAKKKGTRAVVLHISAKQGQPALHVSTHVDDSYRREAEVLMHDGHTCAWIKLR